MVKVAKANAIRAIASKFRCEFFVITSPMVHGLQVREVYAGHLGNASATRTVTSQARLLRRTNANAKVDPIMMVKPILKVASIWNAAKIAATAAAEKVCRNPVSAAAEPAR